MTLPIEPSSPSDFDFFMGSWRVRHQRLKARLVGCTDWEHFDGASVAQKLLGGFGNVDDNIVELPDGTYRAVTIRAFDVKTQTWSIWWLDGRSPGTLDVPVVGRFENGLGTFLARDTLNGQPIVVRFMWNAQTPDQPRWNRPSRQMEARAGKQTGSCTSHARDSPLNGQHVPCRQDRRASSAL